MCLFVFIFIVCIIFIFVLIKTKNISYNITFPQNWRFILHLIRSDLLPGKSPLFVIQLTNRNAGNHCAVDSRSD